MGRSAGPDPVSEMGLGAVGVDRGQHSSFCGYTPTRYSSFIKPRTGTSGSWVSTCLGNGHTRSPEEDPSRAGRYSDSTSVVESLLVCGASLI